MSTDSYYIYIVTMLLITFDISMKNFVVMEEVYAF